MGKRSRAKKQQNAVVEEDTEEEPVKEELDFEKEDSLDSVAWKGSEPEYADDGSGEFDFEKDEKVEPKPLEIKKILLILGVLFSIGGIFGVVGLRTGIIQLMLGDPNPYPGIGNVEPMGHAVSMLPLFIGLILIGMWGIRKDPIYNQIEKARNGTEPIDDENIPKDIGESEEEADEEESEEYSKSIENEKSINPKPMEFTA